MHPIYSRLHELLLKKLRHFKGQQAIHKTLGLLRITDVETYWERPNISTFYRECYSWNRWRYTTGRLKAKILNPKHKGKWRHNIIYVWPRELTL